MSRGFRILGGLVISVSNLQVCACRAGRKRICKLGLETASAWGSAPSTSPSQQHRMPCNSNDHPGRQDLSRTSGMFTRPGLLLAVTNKRVPPKIEALAEASTAQAACLNGLPLRDRIKDRRIRARHTVDEHDSLPRGLARGFESILRSHDFDEGSGIKSLAFFCRLEVSATAPDYTGMCPKQRSAYHSRALRNSIPPARPQNHGSMIFRIEGARTMLGTPQTTARA